jgi:hypothetical protein
MISGLDISVERPHYPRPLDIPATLEGQTKIEK